MFSGGSMASPRKAAKKPVLKKAMKKAATKTRAPAKKVIKKPAVRKPAVRKPASRKPAVRKPVVKKPAALPVVRKPAMRKPYARKPRPGTVVWLGNGQRTVVPPKSVRSPPSRKPQSAAEVDFTPLLGLTAGVVLFSALASARAPPTPSIDANLVLVCTVLAGFAAFVFTGDKNASAASPMPDAAPAGAPAEPARKRDRLLKILRRKAAVATDTTPADAPTYAAEPETGRLGRFALFRARFSRVKSMT